MHESDQFTQQEKDQIKNEVNAVIEGIVGEWVGLNAEGALQYYSTDMVAVGDGGRSLIDYRAYRKLWLGVEAAASVKVTHTGGGIICLARDLVVCTWIGRVDIVQKSGEKITLDPQVYTDVLRKVEGQWKVIYEHPSGTAVTA